MNTKKLIKNKGRSCFGCRYLYKNKCNWFYLVQKTMSKTIPIDVQQVGCDQYEQKVKLTKGNTKLIEYIINKFEGELV